MYLFYIRKVFFEGTSKSLTVFFTVCAAQPMYLSANCPCASETHLYHVSKECFLSSYIPHGTCLKWCALYHSWFAVCVNPTKRIKPFFLEFALVWKSGCLFMLTNGLSLLSFHLQVQKSTQLMKYLLYYFRIYEPRSSINIKYIPYSIEHECKSIETSFDNSLLSLARKYLYRFSSFKLLASDHRLSFYFFFFFFFTIYFAWKRNCATSCCHSAPWCWSRGWGGECSGIAARNKKQRGIWGRRKTAGNTI